MQAQILFSMFAETLHSVWKVIFEILDLALPFNSSVRALLSYIITCK
jgi:hypothetical protein